MPTAPAILRDPLLGRGAAALAPDRLRCTLRGALGGLVRRPSPWLRASQSSQPSFWVSLHQAFKIALPGTRGGHAIIPGDASSSHPPPLLRPLAHHPRRPAAGRRLARRARRRLVGLRRRWRRRRWGRGRVLRRRRRGQRRRQSRHLPDPGRGVRPLRRPRALPRRPGCASAAASAPRGSSSPRPRRRATTPTSPPTSSRPRPPACTARSSRRGRAATATRSRATSGPTSSPSGCGGSTTSTARAGTTCARSAAARTSSTSASPTARTTPRTASSSASSRSCATSCSTAAATSSSATRRTTSSPRSRSTGPCAATDDRWILHSIEQDAEGAHHLDAPIVASPWSDDARMHDDAVTELAVADAVPDAAIAEIVDVDYAGDARTQALDLSVVDGRFAPAVLEAAARRAVEAWAEAVDGADAALERAATPEAAHALLYPQGTNTRLVVRGPRLTGLTIAALDAHAQPPTFTVEAAAQRPPLSRGPRHRRRPRRLQGARDDVHGALDARARRRPGHAVADRRDRRGGIAAAARGPQRLRGPRRRDARRDRRRVRRAAARACSTSTRTPTTTARCSRSRASRARCTWRCWRARARPSSASTCPRTRACTRAWACSTSPRSSTAATPSAARRSRRRCCSRTGSAATSAFPSTSMARSRAGARARACARRGALAGLAPDYGPRELHPTAGATLVAARPPLVAFNVELAPPATLEDAQRIAAAIREGGAEGLPGRARARAAARRQRARPGLDQHRGPPRAPPRPTSSPPSRATRRSPAPSSSGSRRPRRSPASTCRCATAERSKTT